MRPALDIVAEISREAVGTCRTLDEMDARADAFRAVAARTPVDSLEHKVSDLVARELRRGERGLWASRFRL